jgi:molybdate transport system substrate-binding protein
MAADIFDGLFGTLLAFRAMSVFPIPLIQAVTGMALLPGLLLMGCGPEANSSEREEPGAELLVAAAADLKFALDELVDLFHQGERRIKVTVSYGSSGNLFAQIANRAPYDLFFSADLYYPEELERRGLVRPGSVFPYAVGRIVLWGLKTSGLDVGGEGMESLRHPSVRKVAIANPAHAPYGRAAEAALRNLGFHKDVKNKLVLGENIAQAAHFVQSGAADIGIVALGLALAPPMMEAGEYWEIPMEAYPRMDQGGVITAWAKNPEAARIFRDFVLGKEGRAVLERFGFFLPEEK